MKTRLREIVQYSKAGREAHAIFRRLQSAVSRSVPFRLHMLNRSYSLTNSPWLRNSIIHKLEPFNEGEQSLVWSGEKVGWSRFDDALKKHPKLSRTIILKAPGENGEKGVIFVYFEYNWMKLLSGIESFEIFNRQYEVIFAASWSPTNFDMLALALSKIKGNIYVQPANFDDVKVLEAYHPRIKCLDSLACDWVHPRYFTPLPQVGRDIDILMVANWAPFKRHWEFFKVLARMPADLKVTCVGQPEGKHGLEQIKNLKDHYKVPQQIDFFQSLKIGEVTDLQCRSKINVILSLREGGCVAGPEALFAGAALAMRGDACIGSMAYINEETGIRLVAGRIAEQLMDLLERSVSMTPHQWAGKYISSTRTTHKLNAFFAKEAEIDGRPWESDLVEMCYRPYPTYVNENDKEKLRSSYEALYQAYPGIFGEELIESSMF